MVPLDQPSRHYVNNELTDQLMFHHSQFMNREGLKSLAYGHRFATKEAAVKSLFLRQAGVGPADMVGTKTLSYGVN